MSRFAVTLAADGRLAATRPLARRHGCAVAAHGYVANAAALRARARERGEAPPATAEELFALAYRWWGEDLQAHVFGEYVVFVYDERARHGVFAHDALGLVPGFFAVRAGGAVLGSHLDDVASLADADAGELDEEYVADHLALGAPPTGRTPYRAVRRLLPGRSLTLAGERTRERTTWTLGRIAPLRLSDDAAYAERARELLTEGVQAALEANGPVWCELSGGLDSSSVASLAAAGGRVLPALSLVYGDGQRGDERPWMQTVVRRYDLPWRTIDANAFRPFAELPEIAFAEPNAAMPVWPLFRHYDALLAEHGVAVMLTGSGGDEVFGGTIGEAYHLADPLATFDLAGTLRGLAAWQRRSPTQRSTLHHLLNDVLRPTLRHQVGKNVFTTGDRPFQTPPWIEPRFARTLRLQDRIGRRRAPRCATVGAQCFAESLFGLGTKAGRTRDALARSFAYRNPLLYLPLVEFLFAIPWEQQIEPERDRSLQRRALSGILPDPIRDRTSKSGPTHAYFAGLRAPGPWLDMLRRPQLVERGYVRAGAWSEALDRVRFGGVHSLAHFVSAVTLECWLRGRERHHRDPILTSPQGVTP